MHDFKGMAELLGIHRAMWENYGSRPINETLDLTDKENQFDQPWQRDHYFSVGNDALGVVMNALLGNKRDMPARILDFPSGSGRVTRHLRAMFPDAEIGACDLYQEHVTFCAEQFGAIPLLSREHLNELDVGQWDLVFCGSLLTHLPLPLFKKALDFIVRSLSPDGIAIITFEGRHTVHIQDHKWKLISDELFEVARKGFVRDGFGYVDYNHDFRATNFSGQANYGVTLVKPSRVMDLLEEREDIRILGFTERAWDDHQDVVVIGKPGVNA